MTMIFKMFFHFEANPEVITVYKDFINMTVDKTGMFFNK